MEETQVKDSVTVTESKKAEVPTKTFKADGVEYKFEVPVFNLDGVRIEASDALNNKEVLAKLVQLKAGVIKPVGGGK